MCFLNSPSLKPTVHGGGRAKNVEVQFVVQTTAQEQIILCTFANAKKIVKKTVQHIVHLHILPTL